MWNTIFSSSLDRKNMRNREKKKSIVWIVIILKSPSYWKVWFHSILKPIFLYFSYKIFFIQGQTFSGLIQNFINIYEPLKSYLSLYETEVGRKIYDETLACVEQQFPGYLKEIRGTAAGANVPFYKVRNYCHFLKSFLSRVNTRKHARATVSRISFS